MTRIPHNLLPEGFRDRMPPQAEATTRISRAMLDVLASHGYARVTPSIVEFEETISAYGDSGMRNRLLRFSDPVSGHTLAVRGDITMQVGRIATTRLADVARPLRLSYHGQVLRLRATPLRPERELTQIGAELIGNDSVAAASEVVSVAIAALEASGITDIIVDFTLPDLVETMAAGAMPLPEGGIDAVRAELDMKDAGGLSAIGAEDYLPLLAATGPFEQAIGKLRDLNSKGCLTSRIDALEAIAKGLKGRATLTLDPTERHGFEYQSWFGFTIFARGFSAALGRGGTYTITRPDGGEEVATGFSLYPDPIIHEAVESAERKRIFIPLGSPAEKAAALRNEGWTTIAALSSDDDGTTLGCSHILHKDKISRL